MFTIICLECCERLLKQRIFFTIRNRTDHQLAHTITDILSDLFQSTLWHFLRHKRRIRSILKILQCVKKRSVQIKDNRLASMRKSCLVIGLLKKFFLHNTYTL